MTLGERLRIEAVAGFARLLHVPIRVRDEFWLGAQPFQEGCSQRLGSVGSPVDTWRKFDDCDPIVGIGASPNEIPNGRSGGVEVRQPN